MVILSAHNGETETEGEVTFSSSTQVVWWHGQDKNLNAQIPAGNTYHFNSRGIFICIRKSGGVGSGWWIWQSRGPSIQPDGFIKSLLYDGRVLGTVLWTCLPDSVLNKTESPVE